MKTTDHEAIKSMVKRMGEICQRGERHALAGTQLPGMSHGYANKDERDAYLMGMERRMEVMRGKV